MTSDRHEAERAERRPEVERTEEWVVTIPSDASAPSARQTGEITGTTRGVATDQPIAFVAALRTLLDGWVRTE